MIVEDDAVNPPTVPPRSPRRPVTSSGATDYTMYSSPLQSRGSSVPDRTPGPTPRSGILNQSEIVRRGGWYRLGLMVFMLVAITVGLAVGLTVGLRKKCVLTFAAPWPCATFSLTVTSEVTNLRSQSRYQRTYSPRAPTHSRPL